MPNDSYTWTGLILKAAASLDPYDILAPAELRDGVENDALSGGDGPDSLDGEDGDDTLTGGGGDDLLTGGLGDDELHAEEGADILSGGLGADKFYTSDHGGTPTGSLPILATIEDPEQADRIFETFWFHSGYLPMVGFAVFNANEGGPGVPGWALRLTGNIINILYYDGYGLRAGNFYIDNFSNGDMGIFLDTGTPGAQPRLPISVSAPKATSSMEDFGGSAAISVSYSESNAAVSINLTTNAAVGGYATGDTLAGVDFVDGSTHDDTLEGDDADNELSGNDGDDLIVGAAGDDTLIGGAGNNTIDGGLGMNAVSYPSAYVNYQVKSSGDRITIDGPGIHDEIMNVQVALFSDRALSLTVPCFVSGTRILTTKGEIAVEDLMIGDLVVTLTGRKAPIHWLGHRTVSCAFHPKPSEVWPVKLHANCFAYGVPMQDCWLSPDHAVFIDNVLIPVRYLVNGATIEQRPRASVTYHHIELDAHDVIYAEGMPCESYLDTGNRWSFAHGGPAIQLHPDFAGHVWATKACAPLVVDGPKLTAARQRMLRRAAAAGYMLTTDPDIRFGGGHEPITGHNIGRTWWLRLPPKSRTIRLRSLAWIPAHTRADENDTRRLGFAIGQLWLDHREVGLDSRAFGEGWYASEGDWRWTNGDALLDVEGARELRFQVAMTGSYWLPRRDKRRHRKA